MMIVVLRVRVSHLKRKWQHSSTLFLSLQYNTEIVSFKSHPIHLSLLPSLSIFFFFPVSILCVAISERLLLLMGDVNHRCAHRRKEKKKKKKKKKKHVQSTSRAKPKEKEGCCCLFQYTDAATHIYTHL